MPELNSFYCLENIIKSYFTEGFNPICYNFKMRVNIFITLLALLSICHTIRMSHQNDRITIVGGYQPLNTNSLSQDAKEVDAYLRKIHTDLNEKNAKLVEASRQVVAGFNYRYIYRSADGKRDWDFVVYKDLKGKLFENGYSFTDTLSNGEKITAMADPASAFRGANNQQTRKVSSVKVAASGPSPLAASSSAPQNGQNKQNNAPTVYIDIFPNAISPTVL